MAQATYSCTMLAGTGKKGVLKQDGNGYYDCLLGAFDYYNSAGHFYDFDSARFLFEDSSNLMRRISHGNLHGECGHPRMQPGMSMPQFIHRVLDVFEPNISHHIREVWIDDTQMKDKAGNKIVSVRGWVKPAGPRGPALKEALDNNAENVCFSVRSLTDDVEDMRGQRIKHMKELVTWDWVMEPGINIANKFMHPSLESLMPDVVFTESHLREVSAMQQRSGVSMESGGLSANALMEALHWTSRTDSKLVVPPSARW